MEPRSTAISPTGGRWFGNTAVRVRAVAQSRRSALPALVGLGAVIFLYKLGAPSYFIDEGNSINETHGTLAHLWYGVQHTESSPPTYLFFLHYWLKLTGSTQEWVARLPSALCAIAVVASTWRLAELFKPRSWAPPVAALLTAISPLLLQYGQQARMYAPMLLALTLAAIAAIEARRRGSGRWLIVAALAGAAALWLHYFTLLVILPLAIWVIRDRRLQTRWRRGYGAALLVAWVPWIPLAAEQFPHGDGGIGKFGNFSPAHVMLVIGDPFWGRTNLRAAVLEPVGAAIVLAALAVCWRERDRSSLRDIRLLVSLVLLPLAGLIVLAIGGRSVLTNRYASVVVPFAIVAIAIAFAVAPWRRLSVAALALAIAVSLIGVVKSDRRLGFYPDTRAAVQTVRDGAHSGDVVAYLGKPGVFAPFTAYAHQLVPHLSAVSPNQWAGPSQVAAFDDAVKQRRRIWFVVEDVNGQPSKPTGELVPAGYELLSQRQFATDETLRVILTAPAPT